ncbi:MAG: rod shape-determining protein RodA [Eubacteriales bacterium]
MSLGRILKSLDYPLIMAVFALVLLGLIMIGSATLEYKDDSFSQFTNLNIPARLLHLDYQYVFQQMLWFVLGIFLTVAIAYFPYEDLMKYTRYFYIITLLLLGTVAIMGHTALGAQRWIQVGAHTIQPSEFSKFLMILSFAGFLVKRQGNLDRFRDLLPCFIYFGIPILFVLMQPDLGTALVFVFIMFSMMFFAGAKPSILLWLLGVGLALVAGLFFIHLYLHDLDLQQKEQMSLLEQRVRITANTSAGQELNRSYLALAKKNRTIHAVHEKLHKYTFKEYQMTRLFIFLNPSSDPLGAGYHVWQSLIAIGSGGFAGKGLLEGTQSHLAFLPVRHTDFIFSVVGEEFGFIGALVILGLFFFIFYRGIQIAARARDLTGTLLAVGILSMLFFQVFTNIGMTAGIMPVTGIPLPFVSYGGSSLMMCMMALGLLLNIYLRRRKILF